MAKVGRSSAYAYVLRRSLGEVPPREYVEDIYAEGSRQLGVNQKKVIHRQGMNVWHMDLDPVEHQFLLVGAGTGALYIFDVSVFDTVPLPEDSSSIKPMCMVKPLKRPRDVRTFDAAYTQNLPGHAGGITAVQWYPVDNGMFVTGSQDKTVKLWDANEMEVASAFCLHDVVHAASFSPCGTSLLAVGTDHADVRLCDVVIGASTHRLLGHRAAVRCVAWSRTDEFHLATGAADGTIRLWDGERADGDGTMSDGAAAQDEDAWSDEGESGEQVRVHLKRLLDIPSDSGLLGSNSCDPYVVMEIHGVHKTPRPHVSKVVPFTVNPTWNAEMYVVTMLETERERCILHVSVFDHNDILPDELVGEVHIHLGDLPTGIHNHVSRLFPITTSSSRRRRRATPSSTPCPQVELAFDIITQSVKDDTIQLEAWEHQRYSIVRREWSKDFLRLPPKDPYPWTSIDNQLPIGGFHMSDTTAAAPTGFVSRVGWVYDVRLGDDNGW
ncbi:hypothetical protein DYB34_011060, partial [Aphanomyces astaci]